MIINDIHEEALKLSDLEKIRLIELLMDALERPNPAVEELWIRESEERYKAYNEGKVSGIPFEEIERRYSR